ncbi:hypothetical protein FRC03_009932 [Tulasnella sp. 419]|nr:hypothetical protein FRC02_011687 [Tulasnella sp. 418]KAG8957641.1 hypothetical protein FRC03_009932 [Tulasnella sp. 419]
MFPTDAQHISFPLSDEASHYSNQPQEDLPKELPILPPTHFLSLARNPLLTTTVSGGHPFDTSTLAAADFDVDARSGFMPPTVPVVKLTGEQALWEATLDSALGDGQGLTLGELEQSQQERDKSEKWRRGVELLPVISITPIRNSEVALRRAHHVLTFILHLYIHSQPPLPADAQPEQTPFVIPPPVSIPLMELSKELSLPPILTYSDNVLYNWSLHNPQLPVSPSNLKIETTFSLTPSEKHFYLTSARIELRGVEALEIMRSSMDEAFIGDSLALRRIAVYLRRLANVIEELTALLMAVRDECDPKVFYNEIRPWFRGWHAGGREWLFEGVDEEDARKYARMSGPSAGQSSLVHALDVFLGVDHAKPHGPGSGHSSHADPTFLMKMEQYMPRHHRAFLQHLRGSYQTSVRALITAAAAGGRPPTPEMKTMEEAYDAAVMALKKFRDGHIRIATLYIVSQARRGVKEEPQHEEPVVRGTGGTSLVPFLKECRDNTLRTTIASERERHTQTQQDA